MGVSTSRPLVGALDSPAAYELLILPAVMAPGPRHVDKLERTRSTRWARGHEPPGVDEG